jgi:lysozyme
MLGTVGKFNKNYGNMHEYAKMASSSVNDATQANAKAVEQQEGQIGANDESVSGSVKLRQNQRDATKSLDTLINKGVEPVAKGFAGLTSVAQQLASVGGQAAGKQGQIGGGTTLLNKVGIGSPPSAAAPISTGGAAGSGAAGSGAAGAATSPGTSPESSILDKVKGFFTGGSAGALGSSSTNGLVSGMDAIKQMIIRHEGMKTKPYIDSMGNWTVGVGHLIGKSLPADMNKEFSQQEIMGMFEQDFAKHYGIAQKTPGWDKANESGKGAMVDLAFNMGQWWTKFPATAKALMAGDFAGAAAGLKDSAWYKQVGARGAEITAMMAQAGSGGGSLSGPTSQYNSQVSNNNSVVPLPNGRTIPATNVVASEQSNENDVLIKKKIAVLDQLISGMSKNNATSQKILQRQS